MQLVQLISKIVKFHGDMLQTTENIVLRSLQILYYICLTHREPCTFKTNVVGVPVRTLQIYHKIPKLRMAIHFPYFKTFRDRTLQFY